MSDERRLLTLRTKIEGEAERPVEQRLRLEQVTGAEGLSMPYGFELTMTADEKAPLLRSEQVLGRRGTFGIKWYRNEGEATADADVVTRHGVFETFAETGKKDDRRVYRATLVPAFKLTSYEARFRIFENRDLPTILRLVTAPYPSVELNLNLLADEELPRMAYCVQFGETTYNFVHRLLDRFGIAYRFTHDNPLRERMVLFRRKPRFETGDIAFVTSDAPTRRHIGSYGHHAAASTGEVEVIDLDELRPYDSPRGTARATTPYDKPPETAARVAESFPTTGANRVDADAVARRRLMKGLSSTFTVTGQTRNPKIRSGTLAFVQLNKEKGKEKEPDVVDQLLLHHVAIHAHEWSDDRSIWAKIWDIAKSLLGLRTAEDHDVPTAVAQAVLDQVKSGKEKGEAIESWLSNKAGASNPSALPDFVADKIGRTLTGVAAAVPVIIDIAKKVKSAFDKDDLMTDYAAAFDGIPYAAPYSQEALPYPDFVRPVAHGPHTAVVVGPKGIAIAEGEIWADALGRVRVRFPWDPGPPGARPEDPEQPPYESERNTAWVRVVEGWAGDAYGTQFLPRIGQEVVVSFVDGDPERPLITGRVYNAQTGNTHLPFVPPDLRAKQLHLLSDLDGSSRGDLSRSGIKTRVTPPAEDASGFHAIRFEDKRGAEQIMVRSENRMDVTAFGSRYETTRGNRHVLVGGARLPNKPPPGGANVLTVGGTNDVHVGGAVYEKLDETLDVTLGGYSLTDIGGNWVTFVKGDAEINAAKITIRAQQKITLGVGASSVVITPAAVYVDAAMVLINQGGPADMIAGATVTEPVDSPTADPGDPEDWLARQPKGGGGGRRTHAAEPKEAGTIRRGADGRIHVGTGNGLTIQDGDPAFVEKVQADLNQMAQTEGGRQTIGNLTNGTQPVEIRKRDPAASPNVWTQPGSSADATRKGEPTGRKNPDGSPEIGTGKGTGTKVAYDPDDWAGEDSSQSSAEALESGLRQADANGDGRGQPNIYGPKP